MKCSQDFAQNFTVKSLLFVFMDFIFFFLIIYRYVLKKIPLAKQNEMVKRAAYQEVKPTSFQITDVFICS